MRAPPTWPARPTASPGQKREGDDLEAINKLFAPEFRNRLDAVISFGHLPKEVVQKVVDKFVLQLEAQLADRNVTIELSDEARDWLVEHGYDEADGRPPDGPPDPGDDQDAARRRGAVRPAQERRRRAGRWSRRTRSASQSLGFEYPEGPITAEAGEGRAQRRQETPADAVLFEAAQTDEAEGWERQGRRRSHRAEGPLVRA